MSGIFEFSKELSQITGVTISPEHVHLSEFSNDYYVQKPVDNAPILLHCYRGYFTVEMTAKDYVNLVGGESNPHEYIMNANWMIGYFWGGGSMIGGGYYQPYDIVNKKEEVRRYFKILACRGESRMRGYLPSEKKCNECSVEKCPFSKHNQNIDWSNEIQEVDPRIELYKALTKKFKTEFPGFELGIEYFFANDHIPQGEAHIMANGYFREKDPKLFKVYVSSDLIRDILMRKIVIEDWDEFAKNITFKLMSFGMEAICATAENVSEAFDRVNFVRQEKIRQEKEKTLLYRVMAFIKKIFNQ